MTTFLAVCSAFIGRAGSVQTREDLDALTGAMVVALLTELLRPIAGHPEAADLAFKLSPLVGAMLLRTVKRILKDSKGM